MRFLSIFDPKITPKSLQNTSKITQNAPPGPPWSALGAFQSPWNRLEALQVPPKTPRGPILEPAGAILEPPGTILDPPGRFWSHQGAILELPGTILK